MPECTCGNLVAPGVRHCQTPGCQLHTREGDYCERCQRRTTYGATSNEVLERLPIQEEESVQPIPEMRPPGTAYPVSYTTTVLRPGLSWDEWLGIGQALRDEAQHLKQSLEDWHWGIGDWFQYGEDRWGEDAYQAVAELSEYEERTIQQAVWVARVLPPGTRVTGVSWSGHRAVAKLAQEEPEVAQKLLERASQEGYTVKQINEAIKEYRAVESGETRPLVACDVCGKEHRCVRDSDN